MGSWKGSSQVLPAWLGSFHLPVFASVVVIIIDVVIITSYYIYF